MIMRFRELDAWRGLLALAIVFFHADLSFAGFPVTASYIAVDVFFMLSAFVLAHRYLAAPATLTQFIKRRAIRLLPLHLVVLFCIAVGTVVARHYGAPAMFADDEALSGSIRGVALLGWDAALLNNIYIPKRELNEWGLNGASWSISLELWLSPLLFLAFWLRGWLAAFACAVISAVSYGYLFLVYQHLHLVKEGARFLLNTGFMRAVAGFALGYLCYQAWRWISPRLDALPRTWVLAVATMLELAIVAWAAYLFTQPLRSMTDFQIVALGPLLLLTFAFGGGLLSKLLLAWPFQLLGGLSFALYLVHQPIVFAFRTAEVPVEAHTILACSILAAVAAAALTRCILSLLARPSPDADAARQLANTV